MAEEKKLTSQEALAEAVLASYGEPESCMLSNARFGQYTAEAGDGGWYWELDFLTRIGNDGRGAGDTFAVRITKVIAAWTRHMEERAAAGVPPDVAWPGNGCPDGGACARACISACLRVRNCGPLSGVYANDEWPTEVVLAHQEKDGSR